MDVVGRLVIRNLRYSRYNDIIRRNIMNTAGRCQQAVDELESNPYFQKYADKIAKLQTTSPEEFLARIEKQKEIEKSAKSKERQFTSLLQPKGKLDKPAGPDEDPLDKIMKVDLIRNKNAEEVKTIWEQYHIQKDVISATIPAQEFVTIYDQSKKFPIFLFALPRSQGYEFIMSEFRGSSVHFTPLICYQVHKENAPECLTIKHYTEFKDDKEIVLMRGEFDKNVIDVKEAQCLANQLQLYYNRRDPSKTALLEKFTTRPDEFKHIDIIKQIENIQLS